MNMSGVRPQKGFYEDSKKNIVKFELAKALSTKKNASRATKENNVVLFPCQYA